jgi:hypothetical protein
MCILGSVYSAVAEYRVEQHSTFEGRPHRIFRTNVFIYIVSNTTVDVILNMPGEHVRNLQL